VTGGTIPLGAAPVGIADVARAASPEARAALTDAARARVLASEAVVARHAEGERPVYGLNTGLGGNLGHRVPLDAVAGFQEQIIRGRSIGLGPALPLGTCRAAMLCRLVELASGTTGVSLAATELLLDMFNRGVVPVLPGFGSIGASDLGILAAMGAAMVGRGEAWFEGRRRPAAAALAEAGLAPLVLGPKDGLALIGGGAVTEAAAALRLHELGHHLAAQMVVLGLAMEGYAANPAILDPQLAAARPAPGQAEAAATLRAHLAGSALLAPGAARSLQDALCFRLAAPVMGAAAAALRHAVQVLEIEINGATTSPVVLVEAGEILSSPNFHAPALTLALDTLAAALAHAATASALRICKLMTARFSGLPAYLSPVGGGSAGYVSLQKTAGDLLAEVRGQAIAPGMDVLAVSDAVEDLAPLTLHAVRRLERQAAPLRYLLAIEALAAAQAVDLRGLAPLGAGTAALHAAIRAHVPPLEADREPAPDVEAVAALLDGFHPLGAVPEEAG
jgi:histidine ammonia-lyase